MTRTAVHLEEAARPPIPADEKLPQLELVLDQERVRPLVAEALRAPVAEATVAYVRYKPATSCLALYRAELEDGAEAYAYARVTSMDGEYEKSGEAVLSDPSLRLELMPLHGDRRIRGLRAQAVASDLAGMLERLAYEDRRPVYAPSWGQWEVVRYKPERRAVMAGLDLDDERYYLRLYAGKEGERTAAVVRSLRDSVSCVAALGRGLRYSHSFRAVLTDRVPGTPLSTANSDRAAAAARALRELHRCPADCVAGTPASPVDSAAQAVAGLEVVVPELRQHAQTLADEILPRLACSPAPPCLIHGDFDASQVLVDGAEAHLIDFDKARPGDPMEDIASLVGRLAGRSEPRESSAVARTVATFLEAYEQAQGWRLPQDQLSAWIALNLLQMAVEPFRRFQPEWPQGCRRVLTLAEKALQGDLL